MTGLSKAMRLVSLAALCIAAACTEAPTSGVPSVAPSFARRGARGLHRASERYHDRGAHAWTGRSGSAAIDVEALRDDDGGVDVTVNSHRATDPSAVAGAMSKVQVKALTSAGRLLFTRNYNSALIGGTFHASYDGMPAGSRFEVQANVYGIDGRRTDVVTVNAHAARRPDLAVTAIAAPATAIVNTPVIISATIAELNGDHGARADCGLFVNGALVDRANGIWVDAGDVVSCVFTTTFTTTGDKQVEVRISHAAPADANPANNAAGTRIAVVIPNPSDPGPAFNYFADIRDVVFEHADTFATTWTFPSGAIFLDQSSAMDSSGTEQSALFNGAISTRLTFPITRIDLAQTSGGQLLHTAHYDNVQPDSTSSSGADCAARSEEGTGVSFFICAQSLGFTTLTYLRSAGTVTFQSTGFSKVWNGTSFDETTWTDNGTGSFGALLPWGGTFSFNVTVTDGTTLYSAAVTVPLVSTTTSDVEPKTCAAGTASVPPDVLTTSTCFSSLFTETGRFGTVSGTGTTVMPTVP